MTKKKVLVIVGPTASGKSDLAVKLAKKFKGEVISADSRQVYKGLDIGTGKITKKEMSGIPHHLLDVANPKRKFSAAQYQKLAEKALKEIVQKNKLPIIAGGTGFYIQALVDDVIYPEVKPNLNLRKKLESKDADELFALLKKLDPKRAKNIDAKNPRRLVRAIEIAQALGKVPSLKLKPRKDYEFLILGVQIEMEKLQEKIQKRLEKRLKQGMIAEARRLHSQGLSFKRMEELGLEYRYLAQYLQNKITKKELGEKIYQGNLDYAKRQMTWFKKDKRINWLNSFKEAETKTREFLGRG